MARFSILALLTAILLTLTSIALFHESSAIAAVPAAKPHKTEQIRGFSIQLSNPSGYDSYIQAIDDLADMGCTWVNFVIAARQETVKSESISIVWQNIPSEKELRRILRHAKDRGMNVMLMPIVLLNKASSKEWRGVISPPNWDDWFASYTMYITYMAALAQSCDVDLFCVGSELLSTEPQRQRWIDCIAEIRKKFPGKLTYSANWDHYTYPSFWDQVDYIGMNNYNELADSPGKTVAELDKAWEPIKRDIMAFVEKEKKPFFFTETGWHNLQNTINQPWNYVAEGPIDHNEQLHAYQSFIDTWGNVPPSKCMGAFIWEWKPGAKPDDHGTYSLQGTPALEIVKKWMQSR